MHAIPDASKFTRPHLPTIVGRGRLIRKLVDQEAARRILLVGQAAQGKTTLAAEYLEAVGQPAAWLHLDAADGDCRQFFALLVHALIHAHPELPLDRFQDHSRLTLGAGDAAVRYTARLEALWPHLPESGLVVLDGLEHVDDGTTALTLVCRLLELAEKGPRLLVTSRRMPPLPLQRWSVRRQLTAVTNEELAFTPEEVSAYIETVHGLRLDGRTVDELHRITAGWPGGLALLTQALGRVPEPAWADWLSTHLPDKISDEALQFFSEEVFSAQPPEVQDLLIRAALQEVIDPRILDGDGNGGPGTRTLDELVARNLFIQRVYDDRGGCRYRMNGLFRRFLRERLASTCSPARSRRLLEEAAERSAALEQWEAAIRLWLEAGAVDAAADGIRKVATDWVIRGRLPDLSAQLDQLPARRVRSDPWLFFFHVLTRRLQEGVRSIAGFREAMDRFTAAGEEGGEMLALAHLIEANIFYGLDPEACRPWIDLGERWLAERSVKPYFAYAKTVLWLQIGFACVATGLDVARGLSASQNAYLLANRIGDGPLMVMATLVSVLGLAQAGEFERAEQALRRIDHRVDTGVFAEYEALRDLVNTELELHRGNLEAAGRRLEAMARGIDAFGLIFLYPAHVDATGRCQVYRGDFTAARATCRHLVDVAVLAGSAFYEGLAHRLAGLIHYHEDRMDAAEASLEKALEIFSKGGRGHLHLMRTRQLLGLVLARAGAFDRAESLLRSALEDFTDSANPLSLAETHLALGLLHHARGEANSARRHLLRGGGLVEARGFRHFIALSPSDAASARQLVAGCRSDGVRQEAPATAPGPPARHPSEAVHPKPAGPSTGRSAVPRAVPAEEILEIRTFGGFRVLRRGGEPIANREWGGTRPRLLLKAIIVRGIREVPREILMDDLWPESPPEAAARNFKVALHRLRRCLEPDRMPSAGSKYVHLKDNLVSLSRRRCWVDLEAFLKCCRDMKRLSLTGEIQTVLELGNQVLGLYQGDFLPEEPYTAWVDMKRWALKEAFADAMLKTADLSRRQGLVLEAADYCRACLQAEPSHERAARFLMELLAEQGERHEAVKVFDRLREALTAEVGAEPDPETLSLAHRIAAG